MFRFFESRLKPTAMPERPQPPAGLLAFYWHFARQAKGLFVLLLLVEVALAISDAAVPWIIGKLVSLVTSVPADRFLAETWPMLAVMVAIILLARPAATVARSIVSNQALSGPFSSLVRWQSTGTWCGKAGRFSKTTSPAASPTGSCRSASRSAKA